MEYLLGQLAAIFYRICKSDLFFQHYHDLFSRSGKGRTIRFPDRRTLPEFSSPEDRAEERMR